MFFFLEDILIDISVRTQKKTRKHNFLKYCLFSFIHLFISFQVEFSTIKLFCCMPLKISFEDDKYISREIT